MPETSLRARSASDYLRMLQHLLPQGQAWTRAPDAVLTALLRATADELERLDMAMRLLLAEMLPTSAIAGLEDWERLLGLPDACLPAGTSLQERRSAVLARLRDEGRQDLDYWYGVAGSLEYDVTIEEHWPFCCGIHQCGDPSGLSPRQRQDHPEIGYLAVPEIRWWWNVIIHGDRLLLFRCGESLCGEPLMDWRAASSLECVMLRDKLAHTLLTFTYEEGEEHEIQSPRRIAGS